MPAVRLSPLFNDQTVMPSGAPASGYKVTTYAAGSSTPLAAYTTSAGTVAHPSQIVLDSSGYPTTGQIWLQSGLAYKFVLTDAAGALVKTIDNISGINDTSSTASQWQGSGVTPTYIGATSFSLAGDQTTEFHVGRRLQFTTTAGTVYGIITASAYTSLTTVTVALDSGTLDSGLSVVNLSLIRNDHSPLAQSTETVKGIAEVATQAETDAGTDDARMVTPKKLRWGFAASLAASGYIALPTWMGGFIMQWGPTAANTTGAPTNFPTAFPTGCYGVLTQVIGTSSASVSISANVTSASSVTLYSSVGSPTVYLFAFGK